MLSSLTVSLPHEGGVESNKHQNPGAVVFRSRAPQPPNFFRVSARNFFGLSLIHI